MKVKELFEEYYQNINILNGDVENGKIIHNYTNVEIGDFDCSWKRIKTLEHCPDKIYGDFWCSDNQLTSLEHSPTKVGRFSCFLID